jgi:hypothetical protein
MVHFFLPLLPLSFPLVDYVPFGSVPLFSPSSTRFFLFPFKEFNLVLLLVVIKEKLHKSIISF